MDALAHSILEFYEATHGVNLTLLHGGAAANVTLCSPGKHSACSDGFAPCTACLPGRYQGGVGTAQCDACPAGRFADGGGAVSCTRCLVGTYNDEIGQAGCKACPAASYADTIGLAACKTSQCVPGTFLLTAKSPLCEGCSAGTYQTQTGQASCTECGPGRYSGLVGNNATCAECAPGKAHNTVRRVAEAACVKCGTGRFTAGNAGSAICAACVAGRYVDIEGWPEAKCRACEAGRFQETAGRESCALCPSGRYGKALATAVPCETCAVDATCPHGVKTACSTTTDTVCHVACVVGSTFSATGNAPCRTCAADSTCTHGVKTACTKSTETVCHVACAVGATWSATGNAPCAACAADPTCGAAGVKTSCTPGSDIVCNGAIAPCVGGQSFSRTGKEPCGTCTIDSTCPHGVKTACTTTTDTVCHVACVAGSTFSATGNAPCRTCAADSTCAHGVKTACTKSTETVCHVACAVGATWSATGNAPCATCAADSTCGTAGIETVCTKMKDMVCKVSPAPSPSPTSPIRNKPDVLVGAGPSPSPRVPSPATTTATVSLVFSIRVFNVDPTVLKQLTAAMAATTQLVRTTLIDGVASGDGGGRRRRLSAANVKVTVNSVTIAVDPSWKQNGFLIEFDVRFQTEAGAGEPQPSAVDVKAAATAAVKVVEATSFAETLQIQLRSSSVVLSNVTLSPGGVENTKVVLLEASAQPPVDPVAPAPVTGTDTVRKNTTGLGIGLGVGGGLLVAFVVAFVVGKIWWRRRLSRVKTVQTGEKTAGVGEVGGRKDGEEGELLPRAPVHTTHSLRTWTAHRHAHHVEGKGVARSVLPHQVPLTVDTGASKGGLALEHADNTRVGSPASAETNTEYENPIFKRRSAAKMTAPGRATPRHSNEDIVVDHHNPFFKKRNSMELAAPGLDSPWHSGIVVPVGAPIGESKGTPSRLHPSNVPSERNRVSTTLEQSIKRISGGQDRNAQDVAAEEVVDNARQRGHLGATGGGEFDVDVVLLPGASLGVGLTHNDTHVAHGEIGCKVMSVEDGSAVAATGKIIPHDWIIAVNGTNVSHDDKPVVIKVLQAAMRTGEPIKLRLSREKETEEARRVAAERAAAEVNANP